MTANIKKATPEKTVPRPTAVPQEAAGKNNKKAASVKNTAPKTTISNLALQYQNPTSPH
jgi:hypothetical protein